MEAVIDTWIKSVVQFQDVLNGFRAGRGAGTSIMELKLFQGLVSVYRDPLLLVFLYLRKVYDYLDQGRLPKILLGYGVGTKL